MFNKTSNFFFQKYGDTYTTLPVDASEYPKEILQIDNKEVSTAFYNEDDIYIYVDEGIVMLCISKENQSNTYEQFVIHHMIRLKKHSYFNFFAISETATVSIYKRHENVITIKRINGEHIFCKRILPTVSVKEILVYYYQVKNTNYVFAGETHPYWELTFIDSGQLITEVEGKEYYLNQYNCMLYSPGQFHSQKTSDKDACSYLTVIFETTDFPADLLNNKVFHASRGIINTLQEFINATERKDPFYKDLCICYLNEVIIQFLQLQSTKTIKPAYSPMQQKIEDELLYEIIIYINDNIYSPITVEQLCHEFSTSRSSLQQLFNKNLNTAPKQYISHLKLKKAKYLIKENKYTISEISEKLGFTSIHYFSRKFKQEFNLAPSDYAKTIYK